MVWQVLDQLANGMAWGTIVEECGSVTKEAIAEAVRLSGKAFIGVYDRVDSSMIGHVAF